MTTARYGGRLSALRTGRLYTQEYSWYSFSLRAESTPGPWFGRKDPGTVRLVAQRLNHYATPGPFLGAPRNTNNDRTAQHSQCQQVDGPHYTSLWSECLAGLI
jgi:hypothetical protein